MNQNTSAKDQQQTMKHMRNFSIIAHIDHGKSTLADRMLEITQTIDKRNMQDQVLDSMELERERGITIKMQPARMEISVEGREGVNDGDYVLNLIDTPGHIDFSYEVSRALQAVEGSLLLVDATQGVQAQTFTTLDMAKHLNKKIIPVITKVDSPLARTDDVSFELADLLDCDLSEIHYVSGKTGEGVEELLFDVIRKIPSPDYALSIASYDPSKAFQGLVFDFEYSPHQGIILYVRVMHGTLSPKSNLRLIQAAKNFPALEIGIFRPAAQPVGRLVTGEIGYIVTGVKEAGIASVGDTVMIQKQEVPILDGYQEPVPVVWASLYPESQDDFDLLRTSLERLRLTDASLQFEEEVSGTLGRGFRCGYLGMLHLEIITERLYREYNLDLIVTSPSVIYHVKVKSGEEITVYSPPLFPDHGDALQVREPWVRLEIIVPREYTSPLMQLLFQHEGDVRTTEDFGDGRMQLKIEMPLRELMRNFFDELKSATSGYASLSYEMIGDRDADVVRMDVLVANEPVLAFSRIVARARIREEGEEVVERLHSVLPRQQFEAKIQAKAQGKIISSRTLKALRKDVTGHLYGGDITRKMKLREKQKKGKKKMAARGNVSIPHDVFIKMMKKGD